MLCSRSSTRGRGPLALLAEDQFLDRIDNARYETHELRDVALRERIAAPVAHKEQHGATAQHDRLDDREGVERALQGAQEGVILVGAGAPELRLERAPREDQA